MRSRVLHLSEHGHFLLLVGNDQLVAVLENDIGLTNAPDNVVQANNQTTRRDGLT